MHEFASRTHVLASLSFTWATAAQANAYHLVDLGPNVQAMQVSKTGNIAGASFDGSSFGALVYRAGRWKTLRNDAFQSAATAIDAGGDVVGTLDVIDPSDSDPALWPRGGPQQTLPLLPKSAWGVAASISDDRTIVGYDRLPDSHDEARCFRWTASGGTIDLGLMANGTESTMASSIDDHGDIVGHGTSRADGLDHALRFAGGLAIPLESEVDAIGDWQLNTAHSVNENGVIVGWGMRGDGLHAFELVPQ